MIDGLGTFHFFFPTSPNPVGSHDTIENGRGDPSLITDFRGSVGVGEWSGGTGTDQHGTGLFWAADVRFMDGEFIALNGRRVRAAFAFLWLDIFTDVSLTSQAHDFNPGIEPSGLFWTTPIERGSVRVDVEDGSASLHLANQDVEDYGNVVNALKDGPSVPATVSVDASWGNGSGDDLEVAVRNGRQTFRGEYVRNTASLVWSASESGFAFQSDPLASGFAEVGRERNGVFFGRGGRGDR
jgi:hypothetical protein